MGTKKLTAAVATVSWIDRKVDLPVKDDDPAAFTRREQLIGEVKFRFSNFLEAFIVVDDRHGIQRYGFSRASGMYRGLSEFGLESAVVGKIGRSAARSGRAVRFRQLVGSRTRSHQVGGQVAGVGGGLVAGGVGGFLIGGPVGAVVGAVGIGAVGYFSGKEVAELVWSFPPIWTEIELTIRDDGTIQGTLVSHSVFPSNTLFCVPAAGSGESVASGYRATRNYDGDEVCLKRWSKKGWNLSPYPRTRPTDGNPWGMRNPGKTVCKEEIARECAEGYDCTDH